MKERKAKGERCVWIITVVGFRSRGGNEKFDAKANREEWD